MLERVVAAALAALLLFAPQGAAAAADLDGVREQRRETRRELRRLLAEIESVTGAMEEGDQELARLTAQQRRLAEEQAAHDRDVRTMVRAAVMRGGLPGDLAVLAADGPAQAVDRAQILALVARRDTAAVETTAAASRRRARMAELVDTRMDDLRSLRSRQRRASQRVTERLDRLADLERRLARQARRRQAAAGRTAVSGGYACIQATPYSFIDSWGAARSGGRAHEGTDVMAPYGNAVYAFTSGRISQLSTGGLGGITLWLRGNDGTSYYYAHLSAYAPGISEGSAVEAGQLIARNGNTGNAVGTPPHVHFEAHPGGGGPVNPYTMLRSACP